MMGGPIKIKQRILQSGYPWLETIMLIDDKEAARIGHFVGFFHCKECDAYQPYSYPIANNEGSLKAHNERNFFWRKHHHGDGRILLFEKDMPESEAA